ncbi:Hint domain-containing protein [Palleronia sp.]|uniref:Hint domain-containing protein n=1 Tax=Palleronia sp. TaxID=1940284 RepID=UPI0035C7EC26
MKDLPRSGAFPPASQPWTVRRPAPAPSRVAAPVPFDTRYSFTWAGPDGMVEERARMGPSLAIFTDAFAALGRGALIQTPNGPVAVEDVLPGDRIVTDRGALPLRWKGSRVIAPQHRNVGLFRIAAEAFGPTRPSPDLLLGPAARIVSRRTRLQSLIGAEAALMPVAALEDSETVIRIRPVSAMQVFHLGFDGHVTFTANGVELESVHPGPRTGLLAPEIAALYLSMFPHIEGFDDFGDLVLPRLQGEALKQAAI